ncbi:MAG TPA: protein kinase [Thermoanaerobaculia bacterium]|nr:protein kinase [Thermoanaerobaculia bacterium]
MELIGRRFGHIRITDVVGQGGMGDVYAGYDEKLDRKVALKVLHAENRLDAEARERLLREARALSKLDHPNICRIHDYIESSDVDVLVLEYIHGVTLEDVIADQQMSRNEKLRIAIAVADVLVATHRVGIIHRDLKPENVMLTQSGQVKVLDFGLARWMNVISTSRRKRSVSAADAVAMPAPVPTPDNSEQFWFPADGATAIQSDYRSAPPQIRRQFLGTAVGVTMGTPLYMSPEQARGAELTTASDMYSFGLLLQALFTGVDPHPPGLTAREVILRAARGETTPAQGAPRDVAALIARLKQYAPADRLTAVETLARLRHFAVRTQRIVRQAAIAAAIAIVVLGAWRYMVDLRRERAIAIEARAEAEARRAQAENLIEFMLGDLRTKLGTVGRLDILDDVGKRALAYVESLQPEIMSADELARNAKALTQLGDVRKSQGKLPEAVAMFQRALEFARIGMQREPSHRDVQLAYGTAHYWLGSAAQDSGDLPRALTHMRVYLNVAEALAGRFPADDQLQLERAYGHGNVGSILEMQGDLAGAVAHYSTSYQIKEARLRSNPTDAYARAEVARAINKVGRVQQRLGDLAGARSHFEKEVETYRYLVDADPRQTQWKQRLAASLGFLSAVRADMGDSKGALTCAQDELAIGRELAARDPANVEWQRNLAAAAWRVADLHRSRGELPEALRFAEEADHLMRGAVKKIPSRQEWVLELAGIDTTYAQALNAIGQRGRAREMLQASIRSLEGIGGTAGVFRFADAWFGLGEIARASGDRDAASSAWSKAYAALRDEAPGSTRTQILGLWVRVCGRLDRPGEAAAARAYLRRIRYHDDDLEIVCKEEGC